MIKTDKNVEYILFSFSFYLREKYVCKSWWLSHSDTIHDTIASLREPRNRKKISVSRKHLRWKERPLKRCSILGWIFHSRECMFANVRRLCGSNSCKSMWEPLYSHLRTSNGGKYLSEEGKPVVAFSSEQAASGNHKWLIKLRRLLFSFTALFFGLVSSLYPGKFVKALAFYQRSDSSSSR